MRIKLNNNLTKKNGSSVRRRNSIAKFNKNVDENISNIYGNQCVLKYNFFNDTEEFDDSVINGVKNISDENINISNTKDNVIVKKRRRNVILDEECTNKRINKTSKGFFYNFFLNKNNVGKKYYILLFAMFWLAGISVYITAKAYNLFERERFTVFSSIDTGIKKEPNSSSISNEIQENTNLSYQDNKTNNIDTKQISNTNITNNTVSTKKNITNKSTNVAPIILKFSPPIIGNIQKIYSIDKVIYSKTLDMWKIHEGVDISCKLQDNVKSIEKGKVIKIYDDSFLGNTIVIEHPNSYKSIYSNLDKTVNVKLNSSVKKGQIIGKVSNTSIGEIKDLPHLHFELLKNNKKIDPTYIFK